MRRRRRALPRGEVAPSRQRRASRVRARSTMESSRVAPLASTSRVDPPGDRRGDVRRVERRRGGSTHPLDLAVGDVVVGLNDRAWRLAGFDDADDASRRGVRECAAYREATPLDWSNDARDLATAAVPDARGGFRAGPHGARVGVVASRARGDRAGHRRARPLETKKTKKPPSRRRTRTVGRRRGGLARGGRRVGGGARGVDARGARVVAAVAVARVGVRRTSGNDGGARRAPRRDACRLRGLADTCALVVAPREAPERPPERARRDSSSDRDSSDAHSDASSSVGDAGSDSDSDSHAGDVAMQAIAASAAETDASRGEWVRRLRAWTRRSRGTTSSSARRRRRLRLRPSRRRGRRPFVVVHRGRRGAGGRRRRRRRRRSTPPFATRAFARWDRRTRLVRQRRARRGLLRARKVRGVPLERRARV